MNALVVVADEDPFNLKLLEEVFESEGYSVISASNGNEVLDIVARQSPDLLILNVGMPVGALEVLGVLRDDERLSRLPVVLVAGQEELGACEKGFELGAVDYITKPYRVFEIQQRVRNALRLYRAEKAKDGTNPRLTALVDSITGVGTARQMRISLEYEYMRAMRYGHNLTCIVVALGPKPEISKANLSALAKQLGQCVRGVDQMFYWQHGQFVLLLPETDLAGALVVRSRIQSALSDAAWSSAGSKAVCHFGSSTHGKAKYTDFDTLLKEASATKNMSKI